jgi:hypothetical protein
MHTILHDCVLWLVGGLKKLSTRKACCKISPGAATQHAHARQRLAHAQGRATHTVPHTRQASRLSRQHARHHEACLTRSTAGPDTRLCTLPSAQVLSHTSSAESQFTSIARHLALSLVSRGTLMCMTADAGRRYTSRRLSRHTPNTACNVVTRDSRAARVAPSLSALALPPPALPALSKQTHRPLPSSPTRSPARSGTRHAVS